jgi:hypothetical protein
MAKGNPNWGKAMGYPVDPVIPSAWENYLRSRKLTESKAVEMAPLDAGIRMWVRKNNHNRFVPEKVLAALGEDV